MNNKDVIKVDMIVGLPGSGKSTFALSKINNDSFFIDDFSLNKHLLTDFIESGKKRLVITDPLLCEVTKERAEQRLIFMLKHDNLEFEWFLFENDLNACWNNVFNRNDGRKISYSFLENLSKIYNQNYFSEPQITLPVFKRK